MTGHVLECGEYATFRQPFELAGSLQTLDRRDAHLAGQIGVFAIGFLDAAPTRIACDVDDRA